MKKIFFLFAVFFSVAAQAITIDSTKVARLIDAGSKEFCHILDINDEAVLQHKPGNMQLVIDVPVDYVHNEPYGENYGETFSNTVIKDSLNARIRSIYLKYGVELYIVLINSLDVLVTTSLPEGTTTDVFFHSKLYDENSNINTLKVLHNTVTDRIISQTLVGQNRDCIIYSEANYCGAFFANGKKGCWQLAVISEHSGTVSSYGRLVDLKNYFAERIKSNHDALAGGSDYSLPVVVDEFRLATEYIELRNSIHHTFTPGGLDAIFAQFDEEIDYENLKLEDRVHALSVYSGFPMLGDWFGGTGQETHAIKIIRQTPAEQVHDLLYFLAQPNDLKTNPAYHGDQSNDAIIKKLIDHTDDGAGSSDNNYTKLMQVITQVMFTSKQVSDEHLPTTDEEKQNRIFYWDDSYMFTAAPIGTCDYDVTLNADGTITTTKQVVDRWDVDYANAANEANYTAHWDDDYSPITLNPFDLVLITNRSHYGMIQHASASSDNIFLAPAIFLKYADDKTFHSDVSRAACISLAVLAAVTTPTMIIASIEAGSFGMAAFEAANFIGVSGQLALEGITNPTARSVIEKYNMIIGAWGLSHILSAGTKLTANYLTSAAEGELQPISAATAQEYETAFETAGTSIDELAPEVKDKVKRMEDYLKGKAGVVEGGNVASHFSESFISSLNGFSDNIATLASGENITLSEFRILEEKPASLLTPTELMLVNDIRSEIPSLNSNTILQKAVPKEDISKYLSGEYYQVRGYITTAADSKHLSTFEDIYYGMRLDYTGSKYSISDGSCGVIRFKATNASSAYIPKSPGNGGNITDGFPFTGHGFTSGTNGRLGVPEWKMDQVANIQEDAELWEVNSAGVETLKGVYDSELHKFIPVN